jgi:hypothetical protein
MDNHWDDPAIPPPTEAGAVVPLKMIDALHPAGFWGCDVLLGWVERGQYGRIRNDQVAWRGRKRRKYRFVLTYCAAAGIGIEETERLRRV